LKCAFDANRCAKESFGCPYAPAGGCSNGQDDWQAAPYHRNATMGYGRQGYRPTGYDPISYDPISYDPIGYNPYGYDQTNYGPKNYNWLIWLALFLILIIARGSGGF
jgi:hypothetical protein